MKSRYRRQHIIQTVMLAYCVTGLLTGSTYADEDSKYLNAVREFADNVLKYGRDTYGPKHTPLFVDGLNIHTHEPVKWIAPNGDRWILSNLASQQNLFRTLDGLTRITGDPKYKQAAMDAIKYAFENLRSPNGLLYWGCTAAYDALSDRPCGNNNHVFKSIYPYYELMWQVDPEAMEEFIQAVWAAHILDWSNLDMDRIASLNRLRVSKGWGHEYKGGAVFFEGGVSFIVTGDNLFYAAAILSKFSGQKEPLIWGKRIAYRYIETRDAKVGISSCTYTLPGFLDNKKHPLADDFRGHTVNVRTLFPPLIEQMVDVERSKYKETVFCVSPGIPLTLVACTWTSYFLVGELLGDEGREFTQWALEELTARGNVAYRKTDNVWIPMLLDGTSLEGYVYEKDDALYPKGTVFKPISAVPRDFWGYALAYRVTSDEFMWEMARNIAQGNGLGDIGETPEKEPRLQIPRDHFDPYTLLALLELYRRTEKTEFLQAARKVGDNVLAIRYHKSFFTPSSKHIYAKFDAIEALVLLHLEAAMRGKELSVPQVWPGRPLISYPFRNKGMVFVDKVIYTLTESSEPPRSLQEAAACGDVEEARNLITQGVDINGREGLALYTALHRAVINGHKEVVALLLSKGAQVNMRDGYPGATALGFAAEKGHKEIAELLIASGADINATRVGSPAGDTPLHSAARAGHKEIVELLIANGADINVRNKAGQTPLDIAVNQNRKEIVELLIEKDNFPLHIAAHYGWLEKLKGLIDKGADINAADTSGLRPLYCAARQGHKKVVELLLAKGAVISTIQEAAYVGDVEKVKAFIQEGIDVNKIDLRGSTALHFAASGGHINVVEQLISKGADVNAKDDYNSTPLHKAVAGKHKDVVVLLIDNGANVNARARWDYTPMYYAAWSGITEVVELLVEKGADINVKDQWGWTPLHYMAEDNYRDMAEFLIAKGADVNAKDKFDGTPLQVAKNKGHTEIVELLRKHRAKE